MAEALEQGPRNRGVLILADSKAAIQAVRKAGKTGKASLSEVDEGGAESEAWREVGLGQGPRCEDWM